MNRWQALTSQYLTQFGKLRECIWFGQCEQKPRIHTRSLYSLIEQLTYLTLTGRARHCQLQFLSNLSMYIIINANLMICKPLLILN